MVVRLVMTIPLDARPEVEAVAPVVLVPLAERMRLSQAMVDLAKQVRLLGSPTSTQEAAVVVLVRMESVALGAPV
jgi:hypothetical protein